MLAIFTVYGIVALKELLCFRRMTIACTIEAVGTNLALRHTYGFDEVFKLGKLQGCES